MAVEAPEREKEKEQSKTKKLRPMTPAEKKAARENDNAVTKVAKATGKFFKNTVKSVVGFVASLPYTLLLIKVLAILISFAMLAIIVYSVISAISQALLDTAIGMGELLDWENPYTLSLQQGFHSDGNRIYLDKSYPEGTVGFITLPDGTVVPVDENGDVIPDPSGNNWKGSVGSLSDVDFWMNVTDKDLTDYLDAQIAADKENCEFINTEQYYLALNTWRIIRMAYRMCFAEDAEGNRYLPYLEPAVLVGAPNFEKSFDNWVSGYKSGNKLDVFDLDKNKVDSAFNVDNTITDFWMTTKNCDDGPYSVISGPSGWRDEFVGRMRNDNYVALWEQLLQYSEYSEFANVFDMESKTFVDISKDGEDSHQKYMYFMLFSMFVQATSFNNQLGSTILSRISGTQCQSATYFWENAKNWELGKVSGFDKAKEAGDAAGLAWAYYHNLDYDKMTESELINARKLIVTTLAYQCNHMPNFAGVGLHDYYRNSNYPEIDGLSWYAAEACFSAALIYYGGDSYDVARQGWALDDLDWSAPWEVGNGFTSVMSGYKGGISGEFCKNAYDEEEYSSEEIYKQISATTFNGNAYARLYIQDKDDYTQLGSSYWDYLLNVKNDALQNDIKHILAINQPMNAENFYNQRSMVTEGWQALLLGQDVIRQSFYHLADYLCVITIEYGTGNYSTTNNAIATQATAPMSPDGIAAAVTSGRAYRSADGAWTNELSYMLFPLADMDGTLRNGITSWKGNQVSLLSGLGYYPVGGTHDGVDFVSTSSEGAWSESDCKYIRSPIESLFHSNTVKQYGEQTWQFYYNSLTDSQKNCYNERTAVIAQADGYIAHIDYGSTGSSYQYTGVYAGDPNDNVKGYGNAVVVRYRLSIGGNSYQDIYVTYGHLSPDFLYVLGESLYEMGDNDNASKVWGLMSGWNINNGATADFAEFEIPIKQGMVLGFTGCTGLSTGAHLHLEVVTGDTRWGTRWSASDNTDTSALFWFGSKLKDKCFSITSSSGVVYYPFMSAWKDGISKESNKDILAIVNSKEYGFDTAYADGNWAGGNGSYLYTTGMFNLWKAVGIDQPFLRE